ncbi:hypothetical protein ACU686_44105 [Yinghuangia aomiensis]
MVAEYPVALVRTLSTCSREGRFADPFRAPRRGFRATRNVGGPGGAVPRGRRGPSDRDRLRARIAACSPPAVSGINGGRGGRCFFRRRRPDQEHAVLLVKQSRTAPNGC